MRALRRLLACLRHATADTRGGTALIFALALPAVATVGFGAVDLASVGADRSSIQDVADAAALSAAKQLAMADVVGVAARTEGFVRGQLADKKDRLTYTVVTDIAVDRSKVTVTIDGKRASFFANMLPPGGWGVHVTASAAPMGRMPLCVLSSGVEKHDAVTLDDSAKLTAPDCLVHGNADVDVSGVAWLQAAATQTAGLATGRISPSPMTGAPVITDPFEGMSLDPPLVLCTPLDLIVEVGIQILAPGVHCGNIKAAKNSTLKLLPGEHYFLKGALSLTENSTLEGDNVVLVFDKSSKFQFKDSSKINLLGRRAGNFAGFVVSTTRENTNTFEISSTSARELLGTIYIPNATLAVSGSGSSVADQSAWTVIVARSIQLTGSANLVVNANYQASDVPVPSGVGPSKGVVLTN